MEGEAEDMSGSGREIENVDSGIATLVILTCPIRIASVNMKYA